MSSTPSALILLFSRAPILGQVKRRLAVDTGQEAALKVHKKLFSKTLETIAEAGIETKLYLSDTPLEDFPHKYVLQEGADLGLRMSAAFKAEMSKQQKICLIGSDCLDLKASDLREAFAQLETHNLVLGPAKDGGYYLIGLKTLIPELFLKVRWGSSTVLEETLKIARTLNLKTWLLSERSDVDRINDLPENW